MSDQRLRLLERAASTGGAEESRALRRYRIRLGVCPARAHAWKSAGTIWEKPSSAGKGVFRLFCWSCGAVDYRGDITNPVLMQRAREIWEASDIKMRTLAHELSADYPSYNE